MANWCECKGKITLKDEATANRLTKVINQTLDKKQCLNFGCKTYFFATDVEQTGKEILLSFDVRWALDNYDVRLFVKWLGKFVPVKEMEILLNYEEMGCRVLGKYELKNNILTNYFIPANSFPAYPEIEENDDEDKIHEIYMDELYAMLDEKSDNELVYDFNTDEEPLLMKKFDNWNVRILRAGDHYGLHNCLVHNEPDPVIEFYDTNQTDDDEWKHGQFVSRYYAKTLFEDEWGLHCNGLLLDGSIPEWWVTPHCMAAILRWIRSCLPQFKPTAKMLSDWNLLRTKESLEADRIQNALARAVIRSVRKNGVCYLGKYNLNPNEPKGLQEYRRGMIYNFQYDFVIPEYDEQIQQWLLEYQTSGKWNIKKIGERCLQLHGFPLFWS